MGLSRLKSQQSLSQTCITSVPGTPSYMAPECLVDKKKATIESDVWSLGCTLLELFTEKDCWEDLLAQKAPEAGEENDDMGAANQMISIMRSEEAPSALQWIPSAMVGDGSPSVLHLHQQSFTEKDCWEDLLAQKAPEAGEENDDMGAANQMISIMRSEEAPSALQWIPSAMVGDSLENSLKDCFQYKSEKRPKAIDLVHAFPTQI